jgi:hypothetical protein
MFLILTALRGHTLHDQLGGQGSRGAGRKSTGQEKGMMDAGKGVQSVVAEEGRQAATLFVAPHPHPRG